MSFPTPETLAVSTTGAGLNLAAAVGNLASRTGVVLRYARYLLRWLERSGVDEKNVERCMTAARGLAYGWIAIISKYLQAKKENTNFQDELVTAGVHNLKGSWPINRGRNQSRGYGIDSGMSITDHNTSYTT